MKSRLSKRKFYMEIFSIKGKHQFISNAQIGRMVGLSGQRVGWLIKNYMRDMSVTDYEYCDAIKALEELLDELT